MSWKEVFLALVPLLTLIKINIGGEINGGEVVLLITSPAMILILIKNCPAKVLYFICGTFIWLAAQVVADIILETPRQDFLRGWAKIVFFALDGVFFLLAITDVRRTYILIFSISVASLIRPLQLFDGDLDFQKYWKFGGGIGFCYSVISFFILKSILKNEKIALNQSTVSKFCAKILLIFAVFSFAINCRSAGGILITSAVLFMIWSSFKRVRPSLYGATAAVVVGLAGTLGILTTYGFLAGGGYMGEEVREKFFEKNTLNSGPIEILLSGRTESMVSMEAISDSPWIGHGSWPKNYKYTALMAYYRSMFEEINEGQYTSEEMNGLIPAHSYILGAWVESGIVAGIYWVSIFLIIVAAGYIALHKSDLQSGAVILLLPYVLWNILFSPFGSTVRIEFAIYLSIFLCIFNWNLKGESK